MTTTDTAVDRLLGVNAASAAHLWQCEWQCSGGRKASVCGHSQQSAVLTYGKGNRGLMQIHGWF